MSYVITDREDAPAMSPTSTQATAISPTSIQAFSIISTFPLDIGNCPTLTCIVKEQVAVWFVTGLFALGERILNTNHYSLSYLKTILFLPSPISPSSCLAQIGSASTYLHTVRQSDS